MQPPTTNPPKPASKSRKKTSTEIPDRATIPPVTDQELIDLYLEFAEEDIALANLGLQDFLNQIDCEQWLRSKPNGVKIHVQVAAKTSRTEA